MGGASHSFLLRCRRWQKQDHLTFRIKELTAFGIAKLFGRSLKEKHMWLVYEKFCITAQENGFYFFEYCMKNKKDNVFLYWIKNLLSGIICGNIEKTSFLP